MKKIIENEYFKAIGLMDLKNENEIIGLMIRYDTYAIMIENHGQRSTEQEKNRNRLDRLKELGATHFTIKNYTAPFSSTTREKIIEL